MKHFFTVPLAVAAALFTSCATTYHSARFVPAPLEVPLLAEGDPAGQARALLSVRGIRRASKGNPAEVEIKFRIENMGSLPLTLEGQQWELVDSDLNAFGPARFEPEPGAVLEPGAKLTSLVFFPVDAGKKLDDYSLGGFNLRLAIRMQDRVVSTGVAFERVAESYYPPYYYNDGFYGPSHFHVGAYIGTFSED